MICKLDSILEEKGLTKGELQKLSGVGNLKAIAEGADLKLSNAMKIAAVLELSVNCIWPNSYSLAKKEIVTEQLVMVDTSLELAETESNSVFAE